METSMPSTWERGGWAAALLGVAGAVEAACRAVAVDGALVPDCWAGEAACGCLEEALEAEAALARSSCSAAAPTVAPPGGGPL